MVIVKKTKGLMPKYQKSCWFADTAVLIGDVSMGEHCTVWFGAVVRGDVNSIVIGNYVNIQDGAIVHGSYKYASTVIGDHVSIGHRAIIHGCTLEERVLIGMGAIIMDHAVVGKGSIVGAGAVVPAKTHIPPGEIWAGVPAKKIGETTEKHDGMISRTATNYPLYASWYEE